MPTRATTYRPASAGPLRAAPGSTVAHYAPSSYEARRGTSTARGYDTTWREYARTFLRLAPVCACGCGHPARCVDHIVPIRGRSDPLFWAPENHQGLSHACHAVKTHRFDDLIRALRAHTSTAAWDPADVALWRRRLAARGLLPTLR